MELTRDQMKALGRAIAEYEGGKEDAKLEGVWHFPKKTLIGFHPIVYANSLDYIVPIVRKWCDIQPFPACFGLHLNFGKSYLFSAEVIIDGKSVIIENDDPAIAVSLAFAKAAGLKGEWEADGHTK